MDIKQLTEQVSVSGQIRLTELEQLVTLGFTTIVNNRPDNESPLQPSNEEMKSQAESLGLRYYFMPVTSQGLTIEDIEQYRDIYNASDKPILAYCHSGTRSANMWGLMQALLKEPQYTPEVIKSVAYNAGYDLSAVYSGLEYLYNQHDAE